MNEYTPVHNKAATAITVTCIHSSSSSSCKDTIQTAKATSNTWQDDFYDDIPGIVAVFDVDKIAGAKDLRILMAIYLSLGLIQTLLGVHGDPCWILLGTTFLSLTASLFIIIILQPTIQGESHVAVTTEGVRMDISFNSRLLSILGIALTVFLPATTFLLVDNCVPKVHQDRLCHRLTLAFSILFFLFGIIFVRFLSKSLLLDETVLIPFGNIDRLGGTEKIVMLILKKEARGTTDANLGINVALPRLTNTGDCISLIRAMMTMRTDPLLVGNRSDEETKRKDKPIEC